MLRKLGKKQVNLQYRDITIFVKSNIAHRIMRKYRDIPEKRYYRAALLSSDITLISGWYIYRLYHGWICIGFLSMSEGVPSEHSMSFRYQNKALGQIDVNMTSI